MFVPYLSALILYWWPTEQHTAAPRFSSLFGGAAFYSLVLTQLAAALIGGNAMAGERADRSAEFMAYLPVPRSRRLGGKLILASSVVTLIWGVNLLALWTLMRLFPELRKISDYRDIVLALRYIAITGVVFYGVGWLISSFQSRPTYAVAGGLITPLLVLMGLYAADWWLSDESHSIVRNIEIGYTVICLTLAIVCFSVGTSHYLNRVEP